MNNRLQYRLGIRVQAGLTLVELLVVVAVIGILAGILMPAIGSLRETARMTTCTNNMRQLGLATRNYESREGRFPPARTYNHATLGNHNVLMFILPFLELDYISDNIDFTENWNHGSLSDPNSNESIAKQTVYLFICPSAPYRDPDDNYDVTDYTAAYKIDANLLYDDLKGFGYGKDISDLEAQIDDGNLSEEEQNAAQASLDDIEDAEKAALEQGLLGENHFTTASSVRDGLTNTIMLVERAGLPYYYERGEQQPDNYTSRMRWAPYSTPFSINEMYYDPSVGDQGGSGWKIMNLKNRQEIYSFHPDGAVFLYGDAVARYESESMDPVNFANLFTRNGNEVEMRDQ